MARVKDTQYVNPQDVYNYLISEKGLSREHALGMLANIQAESGFNVSIQEKGKSYGSGGVGLFQHAGSRRTALMKYTGGDISNWKSQVDFALQESPSKAYLSKTFSTPEEASTWFTTQWERPANASAQAKSRLSNINKFSNFTQYESTGNDGIANGERKFQVMLGDTPTYISLEDFNAELEKVKKAEEKTEKSSDRKEVEQAKTKEQSFLEAMNTLYSNSSQNNSQAGAEDPQIGTQGTGYEPLDVPQQQSSLPTLPSLFSTAMPEMADGGPVKPPKWSLGYNPYNYNSANLVGGYEGFGDLTSQNLELSTPDLLGRQNKVNATKFPFSASIGLMNDKNLANDTAEFDSFNNTMAATGTALTNEQILASKTTPYSEGSPLTASMNLGIEGSGINPDMKKRSKFGAQVEAGYTPTSGFYGQLNTTQKFALGNDYTNPLNRPGEWRVEPSISPLNFQVAQKPGEISQDQAFESYLQNNIATGAEYSNLDPNNPISKDDTNKIENKMFASAGAGIEGQVKLPLGMLSAGVGVNYNLQTGQEYKVSPTAKVGYTLPLSELSKIGDKLPNIDFPSRSNFTDLQGSEESPKGEWVEDASGNLTWKDYPGFNGAFNASTFEGQDIYVPSQTIPQTGRNSQMPNNFKFGGQVQKMPDGGSVYTYAGRPGSYYQKTGDGKWMISNSGTGGQYVPVQDPTGERSAALNKGAVIYNRPVQEGVKPAPLQFTGYVNQPVEQPYNPLYTNPNARYSETTQQVTSKLVPQTKQGRQDLEFVKQNNANRKADVETFLTTQGNTPEEAAQIVGSYGSDWTDLESKYATDIRTMNQTAATIAQEGNPYSMQEFVPRAAQPLGEKVEDIIFNPFTSAGYAVRGQAIPDYMGEKLDNGTLGYYANGQFVQGRNLLDNAVDVATPIGWAKSGKNIAERATNDVSGDFWTEENAWDALNVLPGLGFAKAAKAVKGLEAANSTTSLARLGNNVLDLAERAQLTRTKPQLIESAIDAGSIAREPFYAPQRTSLFNPGTPIDAETGLYNPLPTPEIPQINPRTGLFQVNNTVGLSTIPPRNFKETFIVDYKSAEGLPEDQIPYLMPQEEMMTRYPWLYTSKDQAIMDSFKSRFPNTTRPAEIPATANTQEDIFARALGRPLPTRVSFESLQPKTYYNLNGDIIQKPYGSQKDGGYTKDFPWFL